MGGAGDEVRVEDLPGVGKRYDIELAGPQRRIAVVVRNGGTRDLYVFASAEAEPTAVVELSEEQARKVAAVLSATFFEA